jgi:hypothetical protein
MRREKIGDLWRLREAVPCGRLQTCGSHALWPQRRLHQQATIVAANAAGMDTHYV